MIHRISAHLSCWTRRVAEIGLWALLVVWLADCTQEKRGKRVKRRGNEVNTPVNPGQRLQMRKRIQPKSPQALQRSLEIACRQKSDHLACVAAFRKICASVSYPCRRGMALLELACDRNYSKACAKLCDHASRQTDLSGNDAAQHRKHCSRACKDKHVKSCARLAYLASKGIGGAKDAAQAMKYANFACQIDGRYCLRAGDLAELKHWSSCSSALTKADQTQVSIGNVKRVKMGSGTYEFSGSWTRRSSTASGWPSRRSPARS